MPFGAAAASDGVRFAVWAPSARDAAVEVDGRRLPMERGADGFFHCLDGRATAGARYGFRFDTTGFLVPDPASRFNPDGVHAPSEVIDAGAFEWHDGDWRGRPWGEAVIYELHVGTFTPAGTYAAAAERLDYLAALGVTAIELMPLAATPGRWNWGYDGVLPFAPHAGFGRPDDLKRFVDAAHAHGLMVLLDVVYNHFGPDGNYLGHYAPEFFTSRHTDAVGQRPEFRRRRPARSCANSSSTMRCTGSRSITSTVCRLDAVHEIRDDSKPSFLRELASAVHGFDCGDRCTSCSRTTRTIPRCWSVMRRAGRSDSPRSGTTTSIMRSTRC